VQSVLGLLIVPLDPTLADGVRDHLSAERYLLFGHKLVVRMDIGWDKPYANVHPPPAPRQLHFNASLIHASVT
jgi:hypothetical protein